MGDTEARGESTGPQPYDHVRPSEDSDVPAGVYRVVGTGDPVVLLRVTNPEGRRQHTGEVVSVSRSTFADFQAAENPDRGLSLGDFLPPVGTWARAIRYWLPL